MKKKFVILIFLSFYMGIFSQRLTISYTTICKTNPKEQSFKPKIMILDHLDNQSIFREMIDRNGDSLKMNNGHSLNTTGFENQYYVKKSLLTITTNKIISNGENQFALAIDEELNWKISSERKKIASYNAQKAFVNYGGRNWTAWFSTDIPVSDGPYIFRGLPGLILSIEDDASQFAFNLIEVKKNSGKLFDARTKALAIDWEKFEQMAQTYYQNPNRELEDRLNSGKAYFLDAKGNRTILNFKQMNKDQQQYILDNNNPIELNHKINY